MRAHSVRIRSVDIGWHADVPPEPRIGATEADNWGGARTPEGLDVSLDDADHLVIGIAPGGFGTADLAPSRFRAARCDLRNFREKIGLRHTDRKAKIGLEGAARWHHIHLRAAADRANVQRHPRNEIARTLAHHSI